MATRLNLLTPVHERTSTRSALPLTLTSSLIHTHPPTHLLSHSLVPFLVTRGAQGCSQHPLHRCGAPRRILLRLHLHVRPKDCDVVGRLGRLSCVLRGGRKLTGGCFAVYSYITTCHICAMHFGHFRLMFRLFTENEKLWHLAEKEPDRVHLVEHGTSQAAQAATGPVVGTAVCWRVIGAPSASGIGY